MTTSVGRGSPSRRKSIAVANQSRPLHPGKKRRAHSIAPGDKIDLASKARRSLASHMAEVCLYFSYLHRLLGKVSSNQRSTSPRMMTMPHSPWI